MRPKTLNGACAFLFCFQEIKDDIRHLGSTSIVRMYAIALDLFFVIILEKRVEVDHLEFVFLCHFLDGRDHLVGNDGISDGPLSLESRDRCAEIDGRFRWKCSECITKASRHANSFI